MSDPFSDPIRQEYYQQLIPQQQEDSQVRWQLDFEDLLMRMEQEFKGNIWSPNKSKWVPAGKRLMNDEGIRQVIGLINANVNKATTLSNLTPHNITEACKRVHLALANAFLQHQDNWEVEVADMRMIRVKVMNLIYFGLKKAQFQGERDFIKKSGFMREVIGGQSRGRSWIPGFGGD